MKNKKRIIILLLILFIIIISLIISIMFLYNNEKNKNILNGQDNVGDEGEKVEYNSNDLSDVEDSDIFFTVESCVNQYLEKINKSNYYGYDENNNYEQILDDSIINQQIYNLLNEDFIKENNIEVKNINNKIKMLSTKVFFTPIKIKYIDGEKIQNCLVYGIITDLQNNYLNDIYLQINLDKDNKTFSVKPFIEEYDNIDDIEIKYNENRIESNDDNAYDTQVLTYEQIVKKYILVYKRLVLAKPEIIYNNYLDNEYKEYKFKTYDNFLQYVLNKKDEIKQIAASGYNIDTEENGRTITIKDQFSNIYTIEEKNIMNFSIKLDDYTILSKAKIEEYNKDNEEEKIVINIKRIIEAINHEDYDFVYNNLNESFKNSYLKNKEELENYIKNKFFEKSNIQFLNYTTENNIYIYTLKIKDAQNENNSNELKIIMRLKEGTDFEISFEI